MVPGVRGHEFDVTARGRGRAQVAVAQLVSGEHGVDVSVDEPGQQGAAAEVDRNRVPQRARGADPGDPPAAYPDGAAFGQETAAVENGPVVEDELLTAGGHVNQPF